MRLLQLHHLSELNIYDVARFACSEYFAAEALPASGAFMDGQGAGLWRRRFGSRALPAPVTDSEAMRIYQLSSFTREDGTRQLVGLGVRTAGLFDGDLPIPQVWALKTPDPLCIFYSTDGASWEEYSLGSIEKADGPYPLNTYIAPDDPFISKEEDFLWNRPASIQNAFMNSTAQWREGVNDSGAPCLWTCSGTHLIEWDGYDARVTPLGTRATALALSNGRFYFSAGSRTSLEATSGVLAFTNTDSTSLISPLAGDERIVIVSPGTNLIKLKEKTGGVPHVLQCVQYVGGQWLVVVSREWIERSARGETTKQELASFYLPSLPTEPIEIPTTGLEYIELSSAQEYFDLGRKHNALNEPGKPPDPIVARRVSGRAFIFQRKDFQDKGGGLQVADIDRETVPVLEMLCNPSLADFDITSAVAHGEGHVLGTADGYALSARIAQNRLSALARLDGAVLRLLKHGGQFYALTTGALWHSASGTAWEVLRETDTGYQFTDCIVTSDDRLFAVSNGASSGGGPNSRVVIYDVSVGAVFVKEELLVSQVRDVLCEYSGGVYLFGTDEGGEYHVYDAGSDSTIESAEVLEGEDVTAAAVLGDALLVGTQSGKIIALDSDGSWSVVAVTEHPIATFTVFGCCLWIGYSDGQSAFSSWNGETLSNYEFTAPCAGDVRVFLLDESSGEESGASGHGGEEGECVCTPDGLILLTDAGPVWPHVSGDTVAFSEVWDVGATELYDEALAWASPGSGSPLVARLYVGPADAGDDLGQYQPLEAGVRARLLRPMQRLRFAVRHEAETLHPQYEFAAFRRTWK